ncbi:M55 family metallopeptidase [Niveispirillum sp. KHB5.9]|uniref:M55 family metallopeptidase n=1 Tax=Niveispirillum sp. KHB5.9 TaxID=3400269 RepID=UPI003A83F097
MRVFICADIEGVAGVVTRQQTAISGFEYQQAREWMTAEVAAACEGAMDAGATEIVIADSHGEAQNLLLDGLPDQVQVVRSWPRPLAMMQGIETGPFAACLMIGHHTGVHHADGVLAHTFAGLTIAGLRLNGNPASEISVNAAIAGHFGVPVTLVTGDDFTCQHARELLGPGVETVATKYAYGRLSARSLMPAEARRRIKAAAADAVTKAAGIEPLQPVTPLAVEVQFKNHWNAELLAYLPCFTRLDAVTIGFTAEDAPALARTLKFITSYTPVP